MERGDGCTAVSRDLAVIIIFIVPGCMGSFDNFRGQSAKFSTRVRGVFPLWGGGGASPQGVGSLAFSGFRYTKGRDFTS